MKSSTPSPHCISHSFVFLGVFLTELPSLQNMDNTSTYGKPNNYHPQCMPCVKNTPCRQMSRNIKGGMVTTPTSLQDFPKDLMFLIAQYAQQITSLSKSCKSMWIMLHGSRIMNTDAWNWVTKDFKRMINVCHLMAHFNDNTFASLIAAKEYIDNLSSSFFVGLCDLMLWSDISGPYASTAIQAINTTLRSSSRTPHTLNLSCYMPSLCASVMAKNLLDCTSLTTLAVSLRIAKNEDGLVSFMDDNTSHRLFKEVFCKDMHIPLSEETPFFGPASRLRLFCLLTTLRNGHFSVFGEDTVQYLGCNLGRSRRHFYVTSGTKSCNLNRIRRQHVVTPGPPIALILCIPNRSRRQQCVAHNIIGSNATVRSIVHADFVGTRHTVWHNVSHNEHRLLDSLPRGHV